MTPPIRVLVVDDDTMAAAGVSAVLETAADLAVVGRRSDGDEVAAAIEELRPDVVLCDVRMPRMGGLAVVTSLRGTGPRFLMMTAFDDDGLALRAVEAGAQGFLLKDDDPRRIIQAVRSVAAGDAEFSPRVAKQLVAWVRDDPRVAARRAAEEQMAMLTEREREFAVALVDGASDAELAARFFVAETTVKSTLSGIRTKWGVRNRLDLAVVVVRAGAA